MSRVPAAQLLELAVRVAREAGAFLLAGVDKPRASIETKSSITDMVSEMDRGAERRIVSGILAERPDDGFLGEEGATRTGGSGVRWIIDPLDGTTNYLYGHPLWSVSIGVEVDGSMVVGVVEAPTLQETFTAVRGGGAFRNDAPLRIGSETTPGAALIGTGFSYRRETRARQGALAAEIVPMVRDLRRGGSAALDLAFTACGRLDGYYERGLNPWDLAAGVVLVEEAGGVVTGAGDEPASAELCIAGNASIHGWLRTQIASHHDPVG
jgi:myo-inositol-1(or 4)-monophosphatase